MGLTWVRRIVTTQAVITTRQSSYDVLVFASPTNWTLNSSAFSSAGTYSLATYNSLTGFSNLSVTPPAGFTASQLTNDTVNKRITVRLS